MSWIPCVKVEREQGIQRRLVRSIRADMGTGIGKTKCGEVKGLEGEVGPCRGLHGGDWADGGDGL